MKKKVSIFIKYFLLIVGVVYVFFIFWPRTYNVPAISQRKETLFWELSTGSRIAYTLVSAKDKKKSEPILFLQGGPGGYISDRNIKILGQLSDHGYDVYFYDQVGSGHSERLENIEEYTAQRHKKDLEEIINKIGSEKVILIGQSWGAILATLYVADNPGKVSKLIVTGPGPIYPVKQELTNISPPDSLKLKPSMFTNREANEKLQNIRSKAIAMWAKVFGNKLATDKEADDFQTNLAEGLNKSLVCDINRSLKPEGGNGFYVQVMTMNSLSQVQNPRPKLKNCSIPILIMRGQCDNSPWGFTTEYLNLFIDHQLKIIPNAGHSISIEQPDLYISTILNFLDS